MKFQAMVWLCFFLSSFSLLLFAYGPAFYFTENAVHLWLASLLPSLPYGDSYIYNIFITPYCKLWALNLIDSHLLLDFASPGELRILLVYAKYFFFAFLSLIHRSSPTPFPSNSCPLKKFSSRHFEVLMYSSILSLA